MIYVATVHYKNEQWIDLQQNYFKKFLQTEHRFFAFLDGIPHKYNYYFHDVSENMKMEHGPKLNYLADIILKQSNSDSDILIFCDGDAFPIAPLDRYITEKLKIFPLAAIMRKERFGDIHPHPAFCFTTVKFWKEIKGDWSKGCTWQNEKKELTDIGGNLLGQLKAHNVNWYPMLRSNKINYHRVFFGVYDDVVYHHGAGFRDIIEDTDKYEFGIHNLKLHPISRVIDTIFRTKYLIPIKKLFHPALRKERKVALKNKEVSDQIYSYILAQKGFKDIFYSNGLNLKTYLE